MSRKIKLIISFIYVIAISFIAITITDKSNNINAAAREMLPEEISSDDISSEDNSSEENSSEEEADKPLKVLFVGNSFTSKQDRNLGCIFEAIATSQGKKAEARTIAHDGAHLSYYAYVSDKYSEYYKELNLALLTEKWDYVVLQEYSKGGIINDGADMLQVLATLQKMIKTYQPGAEILLYATYGYDDGTTTKVDGLNLYLTPDELSTYTHASCQYIGEKLGIRIVPVGVTFSSFQKMYPDINLFSDDNKHANYNGFFIIACCFYKAIFNEIPTNLSALPDGCSIDAETVGKMYNIVSDSLSFNKFSYIMHTGETLKLDAVVASDNDILTWKSQYRTIASVDETGTVTAKKPGQTLITIRTSSGLSDTCLVTVEDEELNKKGLIFSTPYYIVSKGSKIKVLPDISATLKDHSIKWSLSGGSCASVDSTGMVTATSPGRAIIKALDRQSGKTASYTIFVRLASPQKISAKSITSANNENRANIKLSWSSVRHATRYTVYRSSSKNGKYTAIATTDLRHYTDRQAGTNKTYYYKITASNGYNKCESELSSVYARVLVPATPQITKSTASKKKLSISWRRCRKATGYIVYRSSNNGRSFKEVYRTKTNTRIRYIDKKVTKGKKYIYKIQAYRNIGNKTFYSNYSDTAKLRAYKKTKTASASAEKK